MRKLLTFLAALTLAGAASAGTTIKVQAPNLVALDEQFNVTFIISSEDTPSSWEWTPGPDFKLVWGPQKGHSTSVSIVNGKTTSSSQTTYTYVLMPLQAGTFTIPAATAVVGGNRESSAPVRIEVKKNGASAAQAPAQQGGSKSGGESGGASAGTVSGDDLFLRMSFSKSDVVVGETLTATLKLYHRVNIAGFEDARFPAFNGFWSEETYSPKNIEFQRESIGDEIYNAAVLRTWTLIPQQAGTLEIEPAELVCLVNVLSSRTSSRSIFDSFFPDDYRTVRRALKTSGAKIKVRNVPAGAPASFGGGVGSFSLDASLTRDSLSTHEAASLKVTVSGRGNLNLLEAPVIQFPPDFEVYDTKVTDSAGSRTFEYPFIPRAYGDFTVGPVEYSYYDAARGSYVTLSSGPLTVKVSRSAGDSASPQIPTAPSVVDGRREVRDYGSDIRFIDTVRDRKFSLGGTLFAGTPLFWGLLAAILLVTVVVYLVARKVGERRADVVGERNRGAVKMARARLSKAKGFLQQGLGGAFYEELHRALLGYLADKFNMNATEMSREGIASRLADAGVGAEASEDFLSLLQACELARYAPDSGDEAMRAHYEGAVSAIAAVDGAAARKRSAAPGAALAVVLLLAVPAQGRAEDVSYLWNAGINAYTATPPDYEDALDCWLAIEEAGYESPVLCYNIGNAWFRQGTVGKAILYYERALKLDPGYEDARFNLEFANAGIRDKVDETTRFFLLEWAESFRRILSSNAWAACAVGFFALAAVFALIFLLGRGASRRKTGFWLALVCLLLFGVCLSGAFARKSALLSDEGAVVVAAVSTVTSSPSAGDSIDLFVLHEGTKVSVRGESEGCANIVLADGRQGWVRISDIERI